MSLSPYKYRYHESHDSEHYPGTLYDAKGISLGNLFSKDVYSRVELREGYLAELQGFNGVIIYALKNKSQFGTLILRDVLSKIGVQQPGFCHGINMILWQPFPKALRSFLCAAGRVFRRDRKYHSDYLKRKTWEGKSAIIYVGEPDLQKVANPNDSLSSLIGRDNSGPPVIIVPVLIMYGRRREKKQKSLIEIFLGGRENPGLLMRVISFIRHSRKTSVVFGRPLRLNEFLSRAEGKSVEGVSFQLRKELLERMEEEKRAIFGPVLKSRNEIMSLTMKDPYLVRHIEENATQDHKDSKVVEKEAQKYLNEIAADYFDFFIEIWERLLSWLWNNIYEGVVIDMEGLARIQGNLEKNAFHCNSQPPQPYRLPSAFLCLREKQYPAAFCSGRDQSDVLAARLHFPQIRGILYSPEF